MIRIVSMALLLLAMVVGSALAECAWVLWSTVFRMEAGKPVSELTEPSMAYTTKAECDIVVAIRERREEDRLKTDPNRGGYFTCFPDTVDPRGPRTR